MRLLPTTSLALVLLGAAVSVEAAEPIEVGDPAPPFVLPDLDGGERDLAERTGEGPVVLVFFRGAW